MTGNGLPCRRPLTLPVSDQVIGCCCALSGPAANAAQARIDVAILGENGTPNDTRGGAREPALPVAPAVLDAHPATSPPLTPAVAFAPTSGHLCSGDIYEFVPSGPDRKRPRPQHDECLARPVSSHQWGPAGARGPGEFPRRVGVALPEWCRRLDAGVAQLSAYHQRRPLVRHCRTRRSPSRIIRSADRTADRAGLRGDQ